MSFFFVTLFNNIVLGGAGDILLGVVKNVAMMILAVTFLVSVYEAFLSGKGMPALLVVLFKTAVCGIVISNWSTVFLAVSNAFTDLGMQVIHSAGNGDNTSFFQLFGQKFVQDYSAANQITIGPTESVPIDAVVSGLIGFIVVIVYYLSMIVVEFLYAAWGMILMALGPLMIALLPSKASAGFAREWLKNFFEWASWPFLFALLSVLAISATHGGNNQSNIDNQFLYDVGLNPGAAVAGSVMADIEGDLMALLYAFMMFILPFVASSMVKASFQGFSISLVKFSQIAHIGKTMAKGRYMSQSRSRAKEDAANKAAPLWAGIAARAGAGKPVLVIPPPDSGYTAMAKGRDSAKAYFKSPQFLQLEARAVAEKDFRTKWDASLAERAAAKKAVGADAAKGNNVVGLTATAAPATPAAGGIIDAEYTMASQGASGKTAPAIAKQPTAQEHIDKAMAYLEQSQTMRPVIEAFKNGDFKIEINDRILGDSYDPRSRTLSWNPNMALSFPTGTISPALGLGHEMAHAVENPRLLSLLNRVPDFTSYSNLEERRVIRQVENRAARELGEDVRQGHFGTPFTVSDVTERTNEYRQDGPAADVHAAEEYLRNSPIMSPAIDREQPSSDPHDEHYDSQAQTVYWDPHAGIATTGGEIQSPALGPGHEIEHAIEDPHSARGNQPDPQYGVSEERRVIEGYEIPAAREPGEGVRHDHKGEIAYTDRPTARQPVHFDPHTGIRLSFRK